MKKKKRKQDPGDLMLKGEFKKAIAGFTAAIKRERHLKGDTFLDRAMAYLEIGDFPSALKDFKSAEAADYVRSDMNLQFAGIALWMMKREGEAVETWLGIIDELNAGKIKYSDGAAGLENAHLLWFASCHLGTRDFRQPAVQFMKKRLQSPKADCWLGIISKYLFGLLDDDELICAGKCQPGPNDSFIPAENFPILERRQLGQAHFYIACKALERGQGPQYRNHLQQAVALGAETKIEPEYYLARREMKRRFKKP